MSEDRCPKLSAMPDGNGRFCSARCTILSAQGCPANCEHRPVEARG